MCAAGRRKINVPFAQPRKGQADATVKGSMDWRERWRVIPDILNSARKRVSKGELGGGAMAFGGLLDALYLKDSM